MRKIMETTQEMIETMENESNYGERGTMYQISTGVLTFAVLCPIFFASMLVTAAWEIATKGQFVSPRL